jgi:hypothetical protein
LATGGVDSVFFLHLPQLSKNFAVKSEQKAWRWDTKKESLVSKRIYFNNSPNPKTSEMIIWNAKKQ